MYSTDKAEEWMIDMKDKLKTIPVNAGKKDRSRHGEAAFVVQKENGVQKWF